MGLDLEGVRSAPSPTMGEGLGAGSEGLGPDSILIPSDPGLLHPGMGQGRGAWAERKPRHLVHPTA